MVGNGANRILNADTAEKACGRRAKESARI